MWTCPKCGREFKRRNQGHYCGKAPENVDEYISLYIDAAVLEMYRNELADFEIKKNALYLPYDKEILAEVIKCLVKKSFGES